jgi:hypothetical protein
MDPSLILCGFFFWRTCSRSDADRMLDPECLGIARRLEVVVDIDNPNHMRYRFRIERRFLSSCAEPAGLKQVRLPAQRRADLPFVQA